jgi:hypothetical protein
VFPESFRKVFRQKLTIKTWKGRRLKVKKGGVKSPEKKDPEKISWKVFLQKMELKVWVEGIQRIVCGVTDKTTCQVGPQMSKALRPGANVMI